MANSGSNYITNFLNGVAATGASDTKTMAFMELIGMYGVVQVSGITTATVIVKGRINSNHAWHTIKSYTADGASEIVLFPEMQIEVTAYTSGTIYADITAGVRD